MTKYNVLGLAVVHLLPWKFLAILCTLFASLATVAAVIIICAVVFTRCKWIERIILLVGACTEFRRAGQREREQ